MDFYDLLQNHVGIFVLVMTRISGIFLLSPFFGSQNIPMMIRAGLSFALAILLFPVLDKEMIDNVVLPATVLGYVIVAAEELFVGWLIGMVSYMIMAAINMGGKIMDMQIGFAMVNVMDPTTNQQNALVGSFLYNLAIIVLLVTNGHHMILSAVVGSFDWWYFSYRCKNCFASYLCYFGDKCGIRYLSAYNASDEYLCCRYSLTAYGGCICTDDGNSFLYSIFGCDIQCSVR